MTLIPASPKAYRRIVGLRTVRRFRPDPIPPRLLEKVLEAARWTGSSKNSQPWALVVVREPAQLQALARSGHFTQPIKGSTVSIVLVRLPGGGDFDIGRLAQNIMLAAATLGIGSCPVTLHREDEARRVLGVPADHGCRYAVALGFPDEETEKRSRAESSFGGRKPLDQLVHQERFK